MTIRQIRRAPRLVLIGLCVLLWTALDGADLAHLTGAEVATGDWPAYGRDPGGMRHSPLVQVAPANVGRLKLVWTYRTGEIERVKGSSLERKVAFEATPLCADGVLYFSTATARVFRSILRIMSRL